MGASYTSSTTTATNAGSVASTTITGISPYTGSFTSPTLTITPITITGMFFTLNGFSFTSNQTVTSGTNYIIAVSSTTPSGGSVSPTSTTVSAAGNYQLISSGTGNYQGTFSSPVLTINNPPPPTQSVTISGSGTYNELAQTYTLTGSPASPAPTGSPASFTDAGTYTSANISVTPGSGYTLGAVTGSFVINRAPISGTAVNATRTFNNAQQTATVITNVTPAGVITSGNFEGGVTASGTAVGTYTNNLTGTVNYIGTIFGGTLTIVNPAPALSVSVPSVTAGGDNNTQIISTTINGGVPPYSLVSWVKTNTFGSGTFTSVSVNQATVQKQISRDTNFDFTVTISDSQGTTASDSGIINWTIA
jgi:hypothetical protein